VVRRTLPFLLLALACLAHADRVITVPRGGKIPYGTIRGEFMFEPSQPASSLSYIGIGVTTFIDAEVATDQFRDEKSFTELNLDFNLNSPLAGLAPGISFGILDVTNSSPDGRRGYIAVSFQDSSDSGPLSGGATVETTIGAFVGKTSHMFVGLSLPVNEHFRFLAEDDGFRVAAGAELKPLGNTYFRLVFRADQTLLSVGSTVRF
jgi:hypothetical protein